MTIASRRVFDAVRRVAVFLIPIAAVSVIVIGLLPSGDVTVDPAKRADAIARNVRCPFCEGESVAESSSSVASDYRALIREWVDEGYTDDEIYDRFRARFGDGIILDAGTSGWSLVVWLAPGAALGLGLAAILGLRRRRIAVRTVERV
jgi:cytochrome c-type biogenesis protein CcmH